MRITEKKINYLVNKVLNESKNDLIKSQDDKCDIECFNKVAAFGSTGNLVKALQHYLAKLGFNQKFGGGGMNKQCATDYKKCDGLFQTETEKALEAFKNESSLTNPKVLDINTLNYICKNINQTVPPIQQEVKDILCKKCDCQQESFDQNFQLIDGEKNLPDVKINECEGIIDCLQRYFMVSNPNTDKLRSCLAKYNKILKPSYNCSTCKSFFPTGYVNKMPTVGQKRPEWLNKLGDYCIKYCNFKSAN